MDIPAQLSKVKRRRRFLWILTLGYLPGVALCYSLSWCRPAAFNLGASWMALIFLASVFVTFSRCPNCGDFFHWAYLWCNPLARSCRHCGLSLNAGLKGLKVIFLQVDRPE